jgi:hypothetical protein
VNIPPPVLAGTYVVSYAHADSSVTFVQQNTLAVDGEWLGRVPCLAICQDFESSEYLVQHCDADWQPFGIVAGYKTAEAAKQRLERSYVGITSKWIEGTATKTEALALYRAELGASICSFCGRNRLVVTSMFGDDVRICNHCVEDFYESLHSDIKEI